MPLRVLVDGTSIPRKPGGVARYIEQLVQAIASAPAGSPLADIDLQVVCQGAHAHRFRALVGSDRVHPIPRCFSSVPARLIWEQLALPGLARRLRADVIHSPHYTLPLFSRVPRVVTLHDATFFSLPETHARLKRAFFRTWIRVSGRVAAACVTPSAATRDEVRRFVPGARSPMTVAYSGVDPAVFHQPGESERRDADAATGLADREYVAFLATIEPRKNLPGLVAAVAELWADASFRTAHPRFALAIAGAHGWGETAEATIARLAPGAPVRRLGYLPTDLLAGYLGGAAVVAYPSFGEGFGLPVLEAMASGSTVLTTRELALPEVGGDAVAYTATDATSIAVALRGLLDSRAERERFSAAGMARAAGFSWHNAALAHAEAYRTAAATARSAAPATAGGAR